jgi:hypothetical protein
LAGESKRHFSNAFLAFVTALSTSAFVDDLYRLRVLPVAGLIVSNHVGCLLGKACT